MIVLTDIPKIMFVVYGYFQQHVEKESGKWNMHADHFGQTIDEAIWSNFGV